MEIHILYLYISDGGTGDGLTEGDGMCEQEDSARKCLSTGECRICKFVADTSKYEGCDITSNTPICDANSLTMDIFEFSVADDPTLTPGCVACKKSGKNKS